MIVSVKPTDAPSSRDTAPSMVRRETIVDDDAVAPSIVVRAGQAPRSVSGFVIATLAYVPAAITTISPPAA